MPERYVFRPRDFVRDLLMVPVSKLFDVSFEGESLQQTIHHINKGIIPVLVSNHQSHADIIVHALIAQRILAETSNVLNGFYLPYAASVSTGHQGKNIYVLFDLLKDWFEERGVFPIPVTREKDVLLYGINNMNFASLRTLHDATRKRFGVAILPEGSVQGGRRNQQGNIYGMIHPQERGINTLRQWNDTLFLPISLHETYRIFNPDQRMPTKEAVLLTLQGLVGIHRQTLATVKVQEPILTCNLPTNEDFNTADFLMHQIARNLPPVAQGVYRLHTSEV